MPLPEKPDVVKTANQLVKTLREAFQTPQAYRPAHARGRLVQGSFEPTAEAATLSKAPHFNAASTPVIVRFSSSTGIPHVPDIDPNANPRGMAIRFVLGDGGHRHVDIISHSTSFFPVRTGEGFLQLLAAIGSGTIDTFLEENPSAAAFVQDPKPSPASFATEKYYTVNAMKLIATGDKETVVRFRIVPEEYSVLSEPEVAAKSASYLYEELENRLLHEQISFKLVAQVAAEGDITDDATHHWPADRKQVELGTIKLTKALPESKSKLEEKQIIFDPIPRVDGVEPSNDPLLDMRAAVYLLSGKERRLARGDA